MPLNFHRFRPIVAIRAPSDSVMQEQIKIYSSAFSYARSSSGQAKGACAVSTSHGPQIGLPKKTSSRQAFGLLQISLNLSGSPLDTIPRNGPVLFVANHPFGVVDGLAMGQLATSIRADTLVMTHSLVVFPGGGVATSINPLSGRAIESPWHRFVGKLARLPNVTVVPVYFHGQNSRLFQIVSHINYALRVALLFCESLRHIGQRVELSLGKPIPQHEIARFGDRAKTIQALKQITLALGADSASPWS